MTDLTKLADELRLIANLNALRPLDKTPLREAARILRAAAFVDVAGLIELAAKAIYEQWADKPGFVKWVPGGNSHKQTEARDIARAALESALRMALAAREGFVMVPVEPTPEMMDAGEAAFVQRSAPGVTWAEHTGAIYRAMIAKVKP